MRLHTPHFLNHGAHADEHHKRPWASRLGKAEGSFDYIAVGMIVVLGAAMAVGLLTAAG